MTNIPILYEDPWILVINKPAGLPTQPTVDKSRPNLYQMLLDQKKWPTVALHHRLDVPTSGVLLLVIHPSMNKPVSEMFQKHHFEKNYVFLTDKPPLQQAWEVQNYLKAQKMGGKSKMRSVKSGGDFAQTRFHVEKRSEKGAKIQASPVTGRMHQIRIHASDSQVPILGDALYYRIDRKAPRLMLHAQTLKFQHPKTGKDMIIEAPLWDDFLKVERNLLGASNENAID